MTFQFLKVKKLLLRRKLISQNIEIIDNRINNRVISYTKMVHGVEYYIDNLFGAIKVVVNILTYTLFLYTISYIILDILNSTWLLVSRVDGKTILFIVLLAISSTLLSYLQWFKSLIIITPILFFSIYFLSVNF